MDWNTFFFGFVSGIFSLAAIVTLLAFWWMRPYIKAARGRLNSATGAEDPSDDVQRRAMAHLWEQEARNAGWGGNGPWKHWTKRKTN